MYTYIYTYIYKYQYMYVYIYTYMYTYIYIQGIRVASKGIKIDGVYCIYTIYLNNPIFGPPPVDWEDLVPVIPMKERRVKEVCMYIYIYTYIYTLCVYL
jgi:hypothetical protein